MADAGFQAKIDQLMPSFIATFFAQNRVERVAESTIQTNWNELGRYHISALAIAAKSKAGITYEQAIVGSIAHEYGHLANLKKQGPLQDYAAAHWANAKYAAAQNNASYAALYQSSMAWVEATAYVRAAVDSSLANQYVPIHTRNGADIRGDVLAIVNRVTGGRPELINSDRVLAEKVLAEVVAVAKQNGFGDSQAGKIYADRVGKMPELMVDIGSTSSVSLYIPTTIVLSNGQVVSVGMTEAAAWMKSSIEEVGLDPNALQLTVVYVESGGSDGQRILVRAEQVPAGAGGELLKKYDGWHSSSQGLSDFLAYMEQTSIINKAREVTEEQIIVDLGPVLVDDVSGAPASQPSGGGGFSIDVLSDALVESMAALSAPRGISVDGLQNSVLRSHPALVANVLE